MEHIPHTALAAVVTTAARQGSGPQLRIALVVLLVGAAALAWFLLRGYRDADGSEQEEGRTDHEAGPPAPGSDQAGPQAPDRGARHPGEHGSRRPS